MAGIDYIGGKPGDYVLGRGKLYMTGDVSTSRGWRDVGNCTAFTISQESETKEHTSFLSGIKTIDLEVPVSTKVNIAFTIDEVANFLNLAPAILGEAAGYDISNDVLNCPFNSALYASNDTMTWFGGSPAPWGPLDPADINYVATGTASQRIEIGTWLELQLTQANGTGLWRAYDFQATQTFTVKKDTTGRDHTTGTAMVEGTDYELDRENGMIKILATNTVSWNPASSKITVHWTANSSPPTPAGGILGQDRDLSLIRPLVNSGVEVALKFVQVNPNDANAHPIEYVFWKVKLAPEGDVGLISDDWATLSFTGAASAVGAGTINTGAASVYGKITGRSANIT